jgi:hypothetical protein
MPSSGTYTFDPKTAEVVDEAFERCGISPSALVARHWKSARRSLNFMFADWTNIKRLTWKGNTDTHNPATVGETSFVLDKHVVDVSSVMLKRDNSEIPMIGISRDDYRGISDKTIQGRPSVYFLDKQITPVMYYWQAAENTTDQFVYEQWYRPQDILTLAETMDVPHRWLEAVASGLAVRLARKYSPDRYDGLKADANEALFLARRGDDENVDLNIQVSFGGR